MSLDTFEVFFKPEARSSGRTLAAKAKISLTQSSDNEVQAYVRTSSSVKVNFKSESLNSHGLTATCTCPQSKKSFCKHMWAVLLAVADAKPDFLEGKTELLKNSTAPEAFKPKVSAAKTESQMAYKQKQADYRKQQYQKQKQRMKNMRKSKKAAVIEPEFPAEVEKALNYFFENGFALRENLNKTAVGSAMKKLARVFHPDVGGTHSEILELNKFTAILENFLR